MIDRQIKVTKETHKQLNLLKYDQGMKTHNDVIKWLLGKVGK